MEAPTSGNPITETAMKTTFICWLVAFAACSVLSQEASVLRITHFDATGLLQFTNNLIASNKSYRVEYASVLPGPWSADTNILIFATNSLLSVYLPLPHPTTQQFVRVARNYLVASMVNQSNILAILAHEDGERLTVFNETNLTIGYTDEGGRTAVLYVSTNGLPDRVVDGQFVFLFRNFTLNSVDIGMVWPGGSNSIARAVPVDAALLTRLREIGPAVAAAPSSRQHIRTKDDDPEQAFHDLIEVVFTEFSVVSCGIAVANLPTVVLSLAFAPACLKAIVSVAALITDNDVLHTSSTMLGTFLCATDPYQYGGDCLRTAVGMANDALLGARATQQTEAIPIATCELALRPAPAGMVFIPAGSFRMGNCMNPSEGASDELPLHTVYVNAFYMDKYEVTKALWDKVYNWAIRHGYSFDNPGSGKGNTHPVEAVNWYDCEKWCNARSELEGRVPAYYTSVAQTTVYRSGQAIVRNDWVKWNAGYRLPTEAEWEKAARGGSSGWRFPWGNSIGHSQANYYSDSTYSYDISPTRGYDPTYFDPCWFPATSPVGSFAPNGYGLYDMAGNVWERCWDFYGDYGSAAQVDPRGPASGFFRVLRGGGWGSNAEECRTAFRLTSGTVFGSIWTGCGHGLSDSFGFRGILPAGRP